MKSISGFSKNSEAPLLNYHPEGITGGTIQDQSAMKQLKNRKELHYEKANHLSKPKSRIIELV